MCVCAGMHMCMCMRICACIYVCVYLRMYVYLCVCLYVCMYVYVCLCICVSVCVSVCVCICVCLYVWTREPCVLCLARPPALFFWLLWEPLPLPLWPQRGCPRSSEGADSWFKLAASVFHPSGYRNYLGIVMWLEQNQSAQPIHWDSHMTQQNYWKLLWD